MRWGIRNGIFHVAKESGSDEVLGVAMWLRPQKADQPQTWNDWYEGWKLYFNQIGMNLWYGRGGLKVNVSSETLVPTPGCHAGMLTMISRDIIFGKKRRRGLRKSSGPTQEATISSTSWSSLPRHRARG